MSYTFLNALQSLWKRREGADRMMSSWKNYAETHKILQEHYTKKFSKHMKSMHEHLKKGDSAKVREHYKKHLEDLSGYFESALDAHLGLVGADPKHADRLLEHHNAITQKLIEGMPITKSIYDTMQKSPTHQRNKRVMSKMTIGSLGVMAGLMSAFVPAKSAQATRVDAMRMSDFDSDQAFRARDAAYKRTQSTQKTQTSLKMTPEMQEAFGQFMKNFMQNNMGVFKGLFAGNEGAATTEANGASLLTTHKPKVDVAPVPDEISTPKANIPTPPPLPPAQKLEDKGVRPTLKTGYLDVLKEL
ncbi:MAG: hypothetical protein ACTHJ4_02525, partial [Candidatus Nucleicultricaceae bacterium]